MTLGTLVVKYTAFAVLAIVVNLATQRVVLSVGWSSDSFGLAKLITMARTANAVYFTTKVPRVTGRTPQRR
ncbi:MAG: hypothetical protein AAFR49_18855, partial [Pseudomonadota bacterium]